MKDIFNLKISELENDKVLIKPLTTLDFEKLLHFSLTEPELWKYSLARADGEENFKNYFNSALIAKDKLEEFPFVLIDKKTNKMAGSSRFYQINLKHKVLTIGYTWIGKDFQGTGFNKNAKFLLLEYAFETLGADRVEFRADIENEKSINALKALGCTLEGVLRENFIKPDNKRRSSAVLSILKWEWEKSIKQALKNKL